MFSALVNVLSTIDLTIDLLALQVRAKCSIVISMRFILLNAPIDQPQTFMIYFVRHGPRSCSHVTTSIVGFAGFAPNRSNGHNNRIDAYWNAIFCLNYLLGYVKTF